MTESQASADRFLKQAIDDILALKEIKKAESLKNACHSALAALDNQTKKDGVTSVETIIAPFRLACEMRGPNILPISLDCLGKLFIYPFLDIHNDPGERSSVSRWDILILETICGAFTGPDKTDERSQIQIIKALTNAVTGRNFESAVHGTHLLKCVRTVYNIFLFSKASTVQTIAQASLSQMIHTVFNRIIPSPESSSVFEKAGQRRHEMTDEPQSMSPSSPISESRALPRFKTNESTLNLDLDTNAFDCPIECNRIDTLEMKSSGVRSSQDILSNSNLSQPSLMSLSDQSFIDAYLIFRAICKLSMKAITSESASDVKSQSIRSKLLALHLIHSVLKTHTSKLLLSAPCLFDNDNDGQIDSDILFVHAIKQYLCLVITRNILNNTTGIYDVSLEIFGSILLGLREPLKREIGIIFIEIIIPLLESKSLSSYSQRLHLLRLLLQVFSDPGHSGKILVEIYLNYDCDSDAQDNIWERLLNALSRIMTFQVEPVLENKAPGIPANTLSNKISSTAPSITTEGISSLAKEQLKESRRSTQDVLEVQKYTLDIIVKGILRPLVWWYNDRTNIQNQIRSPAIDELRETLVDKSLHDKEDDDPATFASAIQKKKRLTEAISIFNYKPKKGIEYLATSGILPNKSPETIASFLLKTENLSKFMIGEYLGEGDEFNVAVMHAFVDLMDFSKMHFVDALREFLQHFRLPGEAQKIDRFVLKFADRYLKDNPSSFSCADTIYVLAYSVIMLNTDQHNPQVKKRMSKAEFIKNNRGIDNGKDIPVEMLEEIFDDIASDEIILKDHPSEKQLKKQTSTSEIIRKSKRDNSELASHLLLSRTEALISSSQFLEVTEDSMQNHMVSSSGKFFIASHPHHVGPMFQIVWMPILLCVSTALQRTDDVDLMLLSLEGFRHAVFLCSAMDLGFEKQGFLSNLCKFCTISDTSETKLKQLESAKCLLEIAYVNGNAMENFWDQVVHCISQLEKLQFLSGFSQDSIGGCPVSGDESVIGSAFDDQSNIAIQSLPVLIDKIFTSTARLNLVSIIHLVRALCHMSWDEISSSSNMDHPRMYCLQKLLEISYYNMNRIRLEWSQIWHVMGPHLNQVGCHANSNVGFFALDKLRQLACKFLEIEELDSFHFQSDFLSPIERIFIHNTNIKIRDMVLESVKQLVQTHSSNLRSGWSVIFRILQLAASDANIEIVSIAFGDIKVCLEEQHLQSIARHGYFPSLMKCMSIFSLNIVAGKNALQAVDLLNHIFLQVANLKSWHSLLVKSDIFELTLGSASAVSEKYFATRQGYGLSPDSNEKMFLDEDIHARIWLPILFALQAAVFSEDLEVRSRALSSLFDGIKMHGNSFTEQFWQFCFDYIVFPLFHDLHGSESLSQRSKFSSDDDWAFWISTTLIQATRYFVDLISEHFSAMVFAMDSLLDMLILFLTQENESISRVGSTVVVQFVDRNLDKFSPEIWSMVLTRLVHVLESTIPVSLFFDLESSPLEDRGDSIKPPQKTEFQEIISKCVLHLLVIQTIQDIFGLETIGIDVLQSVPEQNFLDVLEALRKSYMFAKSFNSNLPLRKALFEMGFMKQLPNLLRQETFSSFTFGVLLFKANPLMGQAISPYVENHLFSLLQDVFSAYNSLDIDTMKRNITHWKPVIVEFLHHFADLPEEKFRKHTPLLYNQFVSLLSGDMSTEMQLALKTILERLGPLFIER